jgi:nucleoside-diphosphate-sugar epimerase
MNILITGATGFLGGRLTERMSKESTITKITATGRTLKPSNICESSKVIYLLGDLSDRKFVISLFAEPISIVINCASISSPWGSYDAFYSANFLSQKWLIAQSIKHNVARFIYIGTPSIYFDYSTRLSITEEDYVPIKMVNHYAQTKWMAEKLLEESGLTYITMRPRALIGAGDTVIMPRLIRSHKEGRLRIMGDGKNVADLTPVNNFIDAIWLAINAKREHCNTDYNISNGESEQLWPNIQTVLKSIGMKPISKKTPYWVLYAIAWLMETKARHFDKGKEPVLTQYSVGILAKSFSFDITKARVQLGFVPKQTIDVAIQEFADWYQKQE